MNVARITTSPGLAAEKPKRERVLASRDRVRPVEAPGATEADRERSLQEEIAAAEEHLPTDPGEEAGPDPQGVVEDLTRLGAGVSRLLNPLSSRARELAQAGSVDEEA